MSDKVRNISSGRERVVENVDSQDLVSSPESVSLGAEVNANVMGNVSESLSEDRNRASGGDSKKASGSAAVADSKAADRLREKILSKVPLEREMVKQIRHEIHKEIEMLEKQAAQIMKSSSKTNYFELTNIVRKIRNLRGILASLVRISSEKLKNLWLRYVHGIM